MVFHQTALYELIYMVVLFLLLTYVLYGRKARPGPGTAVAIFCGYYGVARFASDALRVNDERVLGPHRRPVPLPGPAPHQRLDLVPGPHAAGGGRRGRDARRVRTAREPEISEADALRVATNALRERACAVRRVAVRSA